MEWLRLIGVAVVIAGFALRLRVTVVVLAAGIATGLVARALDGGAGTGIQAILATLGQAFVNGRVITLVILALPALGMLERYGLQDECRRIIRRFGAATAGRLLVVYHLFRTLVVSVGIRVTSGQVIFTRPIVWPMALPAARLEEPDGSAASAEAAAGEEVSRVETVTEASDNRAATAEAAAAEDVDRVKAAANASDNYANFFGQNLFFGSPGVALVVKNLADNGHAVSALVVAKFAIPMALVSFLFASLQYMLLDRWLRRRRAARAEVVR